MTNGATSSSTVWLRAAQGSAAASVIALGVIFYAAGALVGPEHQLEDVHKVGALLLHIFTGMLALCLGILAWTRRAHWWPAAAALIVFALTFLQASLGESSLRWHVPGALIVSVGTVALAAWTFMGRNAAKSITKQ